MAEGFTKEELDNPEDVTPARWLTMFNNLNTTLSSLQTEIQGFKTVKDKVDCFSKEWKESVDNEISNKEERADKQQFKINLLINMIINLEEKVTVMEKRATAAYHRELRPNLIVHGITEKKDETRDELFESLKQFFVNKMEVEEEIAINDCYRMGQGKTRPVLLKLKYPNDKAIIFENASKLKDKMNEKGKYFFVHDDVSEEQSEVRKIIES